MNENGLVPLSIEDFPAFFQQVHGNPPFPWQERLLRRVASDGWPSVLDLPTSSGKTAALDIAVFHLGLEADLGAERKAPTRIAFVVDRRLVVDDAFKRAERIATALDLLEKTEPGSVAGRVAARMRLLAGKDEKPLLARRLRGGLPREDSWVRTPSQPVILCSTVDQVGSRLLFRGYGLSDPMKPLHAGLIGSDCLIMLDEAHLSEPFRQTLEWVARYKGAAWHEEKVHAPWNVITLSATPGKQDEPDKRFGLNEQDREHDLLKKRLNAPKAARLIPLEKAKDKSTLSEPETEEDDAAAKASEKLLVEILVKQALHGLEKLKKDAEADRRPAFALAVVVNRVLRARAVFDALQRQLAGQAETILLIGPSRQVHKDALTQKLAPIHTGASRELDRPLIIIATQCIEAGVDIDLDGLITEAAPLDALRQRFGRLNRNGRSIEPFAAIVAPVTRKKGTSDPVYGDAIQATWKYLLDKAEKLSPKDKTAAIDFGIAAFEKHLSELSANPDKYKAMLSPKEDAPVLMPAHLGLLAQTSPIPAADPEVALYLHGPKRSADAVTVVWRADIDRRFQSDEMVRRLLLLVPPRTAEAIELPVWAVRRWLSTKTGLDTLADVPGTEEENGDPQRKRKSGKPVFLWAGDEDSSRWIDAQTVRAGTTIVVPAEYGGVDDFGWNPNSEDRAIDVADEATREIYSRRYAVRIAPGLPGVDGLEAGQALAAALDAHGTEEWSKLRHAVLDVIHSPEIRDALQRLNDSKGKTRDKVQYEIDCYGQDQEKRPRGIVFLAPHGLKQQESRDGYSISTTEDDFGGSLIGVDLSLEKHSDDVAKKAEEFAASAGLQLDRIVDLSIAGLLHDAGKVDERFQAWLAYGDPLGPDAEHVLAKSARQLLPIARERSQLPHLWRHEALSVRLAATNSVFEKAADKGLVLWLIGTHHGHGRPFFPHTDPKELPPEVGPQSLAYEWNGLDWFSLFDQLKARYGLWELARMEAILRLADHRASEEAAQSGSEG